ncbi:MAG: ribosome-associated translation inhibitor RaiA [Phaeodactylibacter sp.]|nr:ribosome-associated translation inhibitor RaiA [Phaeodactylibacter sp.]MCB9276122.1 ribosome-associated translation inhibitor RaiA [Lewinellaceae bacterium]
MRVHTEAVQFKADQKLIDYIDKKITKMDQYFDRIIEARVTLRLENSGQVRDKIAEVMLNVPGDSLFVKESSKTFEASVDNAITSLKRQLIKYKDKLRNNTGA